MQAYYQRLFRVPSVAGGRTSNTASTRSGTAPVTASVSVAGAVFFILFGIIGIILCIWKIQHGGCASHVPERHATQPRATSQNSNHHRGIVVYTQGDTSEGANSQMQDPVSPCPADAAQDIPPDYNVVLPKDNPPAYPTVMPSNSQPVTGKMVTQHNPPTDGATPLPIPINVPPASASPQQSD